MERYSSFRAVTRLLRTRLWPKRGRYSGREVITFEWLASTCRVMFVFNLSLNLRITRGSSKSFTRRARKGQLSARYFQTSSSSKILTTLSSGVDTHVSIWMPLKMLETTFKVHIVIHTSESTLRWCNGLVKEV